MNSIVSDQCNVKLRIAKSGLTSHNPLVKILPDFEGHELPIYRIPSPNENSLVGVYEQESL
jgi:hypothetical protein